MVCMCHDMPDFQETKKRNYCSFLEAALTNYYVA